MSEDDETSMDIYIPKKDLPVYSENKDPYKNIKEDYFAVKLPEEWKIKHLSGINIEFFPNEKDLNEKNPFPLIFKKICLLLFRSNLLISDIYNSFPKI